MVRKEMLNIRFPYSGESIIKKIGDDEFTIKPVAKFKADELAKA